MSNATLTDDATQTIPVSETIEVLDIMAGAHTTLEGPITVADILGSSAKKPSTAPMVTVNDVRVTDPTAVIEPGSRVMITPIFAHA